MRIAHCVRAVFPQHGYGGLERAATALTNHLLERGVDVVLFTRPLPPGQPFATSPSWKGRLTVRPVRYGVLPLRPNGIPARLTTHNRRMFSRDRFAQMRPGAYFINTARESLVDERALRQALEQGRLGGAALDVLERTAGRHPLLTMPNVFVTPHIGGATAETLARGAQRAVTAVAELLAGRVPANVVNPAALQAQVIH